MRRALLVGIEDYEGAPLRGCVEDATAMDLLLSRDHDGSRNFATRLMTGRVTRAGLREQIKRLFADPADVALLYFSGHGTENDLGGYLVTSDARMYDEGVWLSEVLTYANRATQVNEVVVIVDACHSGHLGALPSTDNAHASLREGVSVLTASRASQASVETDVGGVFTRLVRSALEGGASDVLGEVTVAGVYAYVDQALGAWDQRPLFKSHVSRMICLRRTEPAIDVDVLRQLPAWFGEVDAVLPLSPRHERTVAPHDPDAERLFRSLQRCNRVKLVEPVDEEDMYYAAVHGTGCRLTALGRFYWGLAHDHRI